MKRRDFLSLSAQTAAAVTAAPIAVSAGVEPTGDGGIARRRVTRADDFVVSAESFCEGHPNKLADLVADTLIDRIQEAIPGGASRGSVEVFASRELILVAGHLVSGFGPLPAEYDALIRQLLRETGHQGSGLHVPDADQIEIRLAYDEATDDIARGVSGEPGPDESALVYGYATDETPELMPLPTLLAHRLAARLAELRSSGAVPWLLPHGRTRVAVGYAGGEPVAVDGVEVVAQHTPDVDYRALWETVVEEVVLPVLGDMPLGVDMGLHINPSGTCMIDGLLTRCGVSGRTVASDTYGAFCPLPATGLSGQGTENIQRSGVLMARHLAKHVVAAGLARRCTVHLAYQETKAEPETVLVDTHGTGAVPEERIEQGIRAVFPLTPLGIFAYLDLGRPIYRRAATFGYFGRDEPDFTWERLDNVTALRAAT